MFGQIFQFAAVLTDINFNILDQFEIRSRRMPHIVPDPGAMMVTGVTPEQLENTPDSYYSFAKKIREKLLEWSPAIFCGYNIFKFDEPFMRSMFYQNLFPPYLTQINGNKRLDVLPLVRAAEVLQYNSITFPMKKDGKTSKKLEEIALANGFSNHNAHDALGDVLATIFVAELIRERAPIIWQSGINSLSRADFNNLIQGEEWFVVHDHNNGWPVTYPAIEICKTDGNRNSLLYDLQFPIEDIYTNELEKNFKSRFRPFRVAKNSEMPLVIKENEVSQLELTKNYDLDEFKTKSKMVRESKIIYEIALSHQKFQKDFEKSPHIEAQIYEDFESFDTNKYLLEEFHQKDINEKLVTVQQMNDERFRSFAKRIIFENFPELMSIQEIQDYKTRINERICSEEEVPWTTKQKAIEQCIKLSETNEENSLELDVLKSYLEGL